MRTFLVALAMLALASPLVASAQTATPVPDAKPDLTPMMYLVGSWTCHSQNPARPGDRVESQVWRVTMDGRYLQGHVESPSFDAMRSRTIVEEDYLTFDPVMKKWVLVAVDNFGGYGISTSPGYTGNTAVWTDTVTSGGNPPGTATFTKTSDTKTTFVFTNPTPKGQSRITGTCTKQTA
jgi:hypothetical protein